MKFSTAFVTQSLLCLHQEGQMFCRKISPQNNVNIDAAEIDLLWTLQILAMQSKSEMESVKVKFAEILFASGKRNVHALRLGDKYALVEGLLCNYLQFRYEM